MSELGCVGNIGSNGEMILVGGYQAKHYLRLIRKYIEEYVRCKDSTRKSSLIWRNRIDRFREFRVQIRYGGQWILPHEQV
jgi:translation initiation factor 2 beta subunit (eIF-2beta)/eIF-5